MSLLHYIKRKIERKIAKRVTKEYTSTIQTFELPVEGKVDFVNWNNPLVTPIILTQSMVDFFKKFIKKGDLVIDIGANIGDTTVPMALAAGSTGLTLAFDPNPFVFKILEKNVPLNRDKQNIHAHRYAITENEEEFYYISSEASFNNGGISPTTKSHHGKYVYPEKIKGIRLQEFIETKYSNQASKLSFIKIDTEGYDKEIIKSITGLITKYKPVIVAESFGKSSNSDKSELFDILAKLDYDVYYFGDFDSNTQIVQIKNSAEMTNYKKTINIYAVPKK
jgi:FkbM family methyltransferase